MFLSRDKRFVVVDWEKTLATLIPHAREFFFAGARMLAIPNGADEAKVCRNVGVPVPSPIITTYDWVGTKPWDIQRITAALLVESPRAYVLSTMGTGKTRSAIYAMDYLRKAQGVGPWLIAAPLSTLSPTWEKEFFDVFAQNVRVSVVYGTRAKRIAQLSAPADFYIINHHGLPLILNELLAKGFRGFVIDELALFRNRSTQNWKAANQLISAMGQRGFAWGMTGSPRPQAPTDAWAQAKLLTPARVPRTMTAFRDMTMRQVATFRWVERPEANDIVFKAMQPAVRFTRDDVAELPPTTIIDRKVDLTPDAKRAYKALFDKMRVFTNNGESVTAANEGVLQNKLLQVSLGFIYTDGKTVYEIDSTPRKDALLEYIEGCDRKAIVFVPFIHALNGVSAFLGSKGYANATVSGATSKGMRDRIFRRFQDASDPLRFIVAHPMCMSHGLTLTAANTIVWYGPAPLETYEQANARITRPGQTSKTLIVRLSGTPAEAAAYRRLSSRQKSQGILLELFHQQELDF